MRTRARARGVCVCVCVCVWCLCVWGGVKKKEDSLGDASLPHLRRKLAMGLGRRCADFSADWARRCATAVLRLPALRVPVRRRRRRTVRRRGGRRRFDVKSARGGFSFWPPPFLYSFILRGVHIGLYTVSSCSACALMYPVKHAFVLFRVLSRAHTLWSCRPLARAHSKTVRRSKSRRLSRYSLSLSLCPKTRRRTGPPTCWCNRSRPAWVGIGAAAQPSTVLHSASVLVLV